MSQKTKGSQAWARRSLKVLPYFLVVFFFLVIAFSAGYISARRNYALGIFRRPVDFLQGYFVDNFEDEKIVRNFPLEYLKNGTLEELQVQVTYPHSWFFMVKDIEEEIENAIPEDKEFLIRTPNNKAVLTIKLLDVDYSRSVSGFSTTTTTLSQEIVEKRVVSYLLPDRQEQSFISTYQRRENDNKISYVQGIESRTTPPEETRRLDSFIIFNHADDPETEENILLITNIFVEFEESLTNQEKSTILKETDNIVSSLQLN